MPDPSLLVLLGDVISGPLSRIFGSCVRDINLRKLRGQSFRFTHTDYWRVPKPNQNAAPQVVELRKALDLTASGLTPDPRE